MYNQDDFVLRSDVLCEVCDLLCQNPPEDCELEGGPQRCGDYLRFLRIKPADAAQVAYGFWKRIDYQPFGHDYQCSVCNSKHAGPYNYCPTCGAYMKGRLK